METILVPWVHLVSAAAAVALVMSVVEGAALTACVAFVLRLCPGLSAGVRSAVWTVALGVSVLLPVGSLVMAGGGRETPRGVAEVGEGWALALVGAWATMSAVRIALLVRSAVRLGQIWRRAVPVEASSGCGDLLRAGRRSAELCVSADVDRPSVVGFLRPRVLLPAALLGELRPEEMEHIVRHEMKHLERRDDWTNLLQKVSVAVFPLNPVLFWLDRRMCRERELACDDGVLRQTRARKVYAACLTNLAATRMAQRGGGLLLGAWGRESELVGRVHRILRWRESGTGRRGSMALSAALMLSVAGGGVEMARWPELVRFSSGRAIVADAAGRPELAGPVRRTGSMEPVAAAWEDRSRTAKPMLVKAVMPEARATGLPVRSPGRRHRLLRAAAVTRRVRQARVRPWDEMETAPRVVVTAWPGGEFPARVVLTVAEDGQPRYAAFATRDGWLFVSL